MKDQIDKYTWKALKHHDDGALREYYQLLRETKTLHTTRCVKCENIAYPPRPFCPSCFHDEVSWVPIGEKATLYAFTTQARALRFVAPDVIGVVEIEGVGRILTKINARLEELKIGQELKFEPFEISEKLVVHSYTPV